MTLLNFRKTLSALVLRSFPAFITADQRFFALSLKMGSHIPAGWLCRSPQIAHQLTLLVVFQERFAWLRELCVALLASMFYSALHNVLIQ